MACMVYGVGNKIRIIVQYDLVVFYFVKVWNNFLSTFNT